MYTIGGIEVMELGVGTLNMCTVIKKGLFWFEIYAFSYVYN